MLKLVFIGVDRNAKGGIASVLLAYKNIFPDARFVATTSAKGKLGKLTTVIKALITVFYLAMVNRNIVFHIHGASYTSFRRKYLFYRIVYLFKRKVIYHIHGGEFHLFYDRAGSGLKKKITRLINNVDCVICLSEQWKNFFETNFNPKRLEIIKNVVNRPVSYPSDQHEKTRFLFLGFLTEGKGIWLLLEAVKELAFRGRRFELIVGGNGDVQKLNELIKTYEIEEYTDYKGWISGNKKIELLSTSDVFILPSYNEGVPISILEAMSFDKPVIATHVGGIPDILTKNDGILIEPGNLEQLIEAMDYAICNQEEMRSLGLGSSKKIQAHYPETVKSKLLHVYSEITTNES